MLSLLFYHSQKNKALELTSVILKEAIAHYRCSLLLQDSALKSTTMHRVGNAPGFWSPAMPLLVLRTCATVHMRPPLSHRVHFGGGLIPASGDHVNKARAGPLRVSAPADMILSENKDAAKVENGTPSFPNISMLQIFGFFLKLAVACAGVVVFMCHLGLTHYQSVSI